MGKLVPDVGIGEQSMTIDANSERLGEAREWAHRAATEAGFGDADCYQVKLAVSEAVANAIQHGSQGHGDQIGIAAFEADGSLVFEVRDRGTFVAPLTRATIDDESGRGLELLSLMMDEVHITSSEEGSLLRFSKKLAATA